MKVNYSEIISSVEFSNGESISIGDMLEKWEGVVISINIFKHVDAVEVLFQDGDEGYSVYFNSEGEQVDEDEYLN
jgi:hypothetical protein